jgi:hypothetical protein
MLLHLSADGCRRCHPPLTEVANIREWRREWQPHHSRKNGRETQKETFWKIAIIANSPAGPDGARKFDFLNDFFLFFSILGRACSCRRCLQHVRLKVGRALCHAGFHLSWNTRRQDKRAHASIFGTDCTILLRQPFQKQS